MDPARPRIRRKPAPSIDARYPAPDPTDPFAPLWVLRSRSSSPSLGAVVRKQPSYHILAEAPPPSHIAFPAIEVVADHSEAPVVWQASPVRLAARLLGRTPSMSPRGPIHKHLISKPHSLDVDRTRVQSESIVLQRTSSLSTSPHRVQLQPSANSSATTISHRPTTSSSLASSSSFVHVSEEGEFLRGAYVDPRPAPVPARIPVSASMPFPLSRPRPAPAHYAHRHSFCSTSRPAPSNHTTTVVHPEWALPPPAHLARAAALPVIAASGLRVPFASLFAAHRTLVLFVRHFWCPMCQEYVSAIADALRAAGGHLLAEDGEKVQLVIISNGAPAFIPKYKTLFGLPAAPACEVYVDPTQAVYTALGMGSSSSCGQEHLCRPTNKETVRDGGYVRHGLVRGLALVVLRALKGGLPVFERGGDVSQLGGEFVMGPGLKCTYAHRMQNPKGHAPLRDVLSAAGVRLLTSTGSLPSPLSGLPSFTLRNRKGRRSLLGRKTTAKRNKLIKSPTPSPVHSPKSKTIESTEAKAGEADMKEFGVVAPRRAPLPRTLFGRASLDITNINTTVPCTYRHSQIYAQSYPPSQLQARLAPRRPSHSRSLDLGPGLGFKLGARGMSRADEDKWMEARMASLDVLKERRRERRGWGVGTGEGEQSENVVREEESEKAGTPVGDVMIIGLGLGITSDGPAV